MKRVYLSALVSCFAMACSASPKINVGGGSDGGGSGGSSGTAGVGGFGGIGGASGDGNALTAHIEEPPSTMAIEVITISCAGDCADVIAVARGGNAPYTFAWNDGVTTAAREICPTDDTTFTVTVKDTEIVGDEFYAAQMATVSVTANVLDCLDAGIADDGGTPTWTDCFDNPSFEGAVTATQFEAFNAPPWNACYAGGLTYAAIGNSSLWPQQNWTFPAPSHGATYLALGQQFAFVGRASQPLCAPIAAGTSRSFLVDLARATSSNPGGEATEQVVRVLGGDSCAEGELLWTSPPLSTTWTTHCVTLQPQTDMANIAFVPQGTGGGGLVEALVDHIVPVETCP